MNNPINFRDPSGKLIIFIPVLIELACSGPTIIMVAVELSALEVAVLGAVTAIGGGVSGGMPDWWDDWIDDFLDRHSPGKKPNEDCNIDDCIEDCYRDLTGNGNTSEFDKCMDNCKCNK